MGSWLGIRVAALQPYLQPSLAPYSKVHPVVFHNAIADMQNRKYGLSYLCLTAGLPLKLQAYAIFFRPLIKKGLKSEARSIQVSSCSQNQKIVWCIMLSCLVLVRFHIEDHYFPVMLLGLPTIFFY